ncbi:hypothetical protein VTI74DRAFT_3808 [Chaetomium olivicolor]
MLAINNRDATSTGISLFFLTHGYDVDLLNLSDGQEELRTTGNSPVARGEAFVAKLKGAVEVAQAAVATVQELQERRNAKYTLTELIGSHACRLDTPPGVHNVFRVMHLKRASDDPLPSQVQDDTHPPAIVPEDIPDGEEEWQVEEVLKAKKTRRATKVLVKGSGPVQGYPREITEDDAPPGRGEEGGNVTG